VTTPTPTDAQLVNALVGEAVKLLSSAGASADILGAFAVGYPAKVMELVGKPRPEQEAVDLEQLVLDTMTTALRRAGLVRSEVAKDPTRMTVNVQIQGRRTSVKVRSALLNTLTEVTGTKESAKRAIQDIADSMPGDVQNRSAWIDDKINGFLMMSKTDQSKAMTH